MTNEQHHLANLVWSVADLLRDDFKPSQYGSVLLPFTILRRLECLRGNGLSLKQLAAEPSVSAERMLRYLDTFSPDIRGVMHRYDLSGSIRRLESTGILRQVVAEFAELDLRPEAVSDHHLGNLFDDLVRLVAERSVETAGEHFTPPDVCRLVAALLLQRDASTLRAPGVFRAILDPVCGTGGLLSAVEEHVSDLNPDAKLSISGQEINSETWALCSSRMIVSGHDPGGIALGDIFSDDCHQGAQFDYLVANPPFGVAWRSRSDFVKHEHEVLGTAGRFGAGLPRINDGSLLFLQHMLAKMKSTGSRIAVLFTGAPMSAGGAGSGESDIRRWVIENDWLEAIVALPDALFYNTAIPTYLWTLTNRKSVDRRGKVVLLNARDLAQQMRRPIGSKRKYFSSEQINEIVRSHGEAALAAADAEHPLHERVRVLDNRELGYQQITVERPLRLRFELSEEALIKLADARAVRQSADPEGLVAALRPLVGSAWTDKAKAFADLDRAVTASGHTWPTRAAFQRALRDAIGVRDPQGQVQHDRDGPVPNSRQRRIVRVPLDTNPEEYLHREILAHTPEAWIDHTKTRIGYEISSTLFFRPSLNTRFVPLGQVANLRAATVGRIGGENRPRHLRAEDLHSVDSSAELPEVPESASALTLCAGGDLVGRSGDWRLLPAGFGEAATMLSVLRPKGDDGRALCEWLNSRNGHEQFQAARRDLVNLPVPVDLIRDEKVNDLLEDVQSGRRTLREATAGLLPNVFTDTRRDVRDLREGMRSIAAQARLVGELVRPVVDPCGRQSGPTRSTWGRWPVDTGSVPSPPSAKMRCSNWGRG